MPLLYTTLRSHSRGAPNLKRHLPQLPGSRQARQVRWRTSAQLLDGRARSGLNSTRCAIRQILLSNNGNHWAAQKRQLGTSRSTQSGVARISCRARWYCGLCGPCHPSHNHTTAILEWKQSETQSKRMGTWLCPETIIYKNPAGWMWLKGQSISTGTRSPDLPGIGLCVYRSHCLSLLLRMAAKRAHVPQLLNGI